MRALSQLFLAAFEVRLASRSVTGLCPFKPPPRVTLTDARKMVWFSDLANNLVILQNLSRTIPHGIRGKMLLDQCRTYHIPISRAIWLIKCVGANELRTFKRKGVSGQVTIENEKKWIQTWTVQVMGFLWDIMQTQNSFGELSYGFQLVSCLYAEHLLDETLFLDGILEKYETCQEEETLFWLGLCSTWLAEILQTFRHAHRLALVSFQKLKQFSSTASDQIRGPVPTHLYKIVRHVLMSRPLVFYCQCIWDVSTSLELKKTFTNTDHDALGTVEKVESSIQTILGVSMCHSQTSSAVNDKASLIALLDNLANHQCFTRVLDHVNNENVERIINAVMVWACTEYRAIQGSSGIAHSLFQKIVERLPASRNLITFAIMRCASTYSTSPTKLARLAVKLVHSFLLDIKIYFHALITFGSLNNDTQSTLACRCHIMILEDIPRQRLPPHLASMQHQLLFRLGSGLTGNRNARPSAHAIPSAFPTLSQDLQTSVFGIPLHGIAELTHSNLLELITTIQRTVQNLQFNHFSDTISPSQRVTIAICNILHMVDDADLFLPILTPLIRAASSVTLLSVGSLIKTFETSLKVVGSLDHIRDVLISRYRALRFREPPSGDLVVILLSLKSLEPWSRRFLGDELCLFGQTQGLAANTPASDVLEHEDNAAHSVVELLVKKLKNSETALLSSQQLEHLVTQAEAQGASPVELTRCKLEVLELLFPKEPFVASQTQSYPPLVSPAPEVVLDIITQLLAETKDDEFLTKFECIAVRKRLRGFLVNLIVHNEARVETSFAKLIDSDPCPKVMQCIHTLILTLISPNNIIHFATNIDSPEYSQEKFDDSLLLPTIESIMEIEDPLCSQVLQFGMRLLIRGAVSACPKRRLNIQSTIVSGILQSIRKWTHQWRMSLARLPWSSEIASQMLDLAELSLLGKLSRSEAHAELPFLCLSKSQLLEVIQFAKKYSHTSDDSWKRASEISSAVASYAFRQDSRDCSDLEVYLRLIAIHRGSTMTETETLDLLSSMCQIVASRDAWPSTTFKVLAYSSAASLSSKLSLVSISDLFSSLPKGVVENSDVCFLLGHNSQIARFAVRTRGTLNSPSSISQALAAFNLAAEDPTEPLPSHHTFEPRDWDLLRDSSTREGENDTPLSLKLFEARKIHQ